jgi:hypothetical protein
MGGFAEAGILGGGMVDVFLVVDSWGDTTWVTTGGALAVAYPGGCSTEDLKVGEEGSLLLVELNLEAPNPVMFEDGGGAVVFVGMVGGGTTVLLVVLVLTGGAVVVLVVVVVVLGAGRAVTPAVISSKKDMMSLLLLL